jgi:NAD(P)-dependent dehydrogenase (short-subunit alcohol dehydrogenase family)
VDTANLSGRTVAVTGAGSGIGRETALLAARRGADLAICDVNETGLADVEAKAKGLGRSVIARRVDVADREQMRDFAATVHEQVDAVDLVVNNAGVGLGAGLLETELEDWDWIVSINIMGVVHGCHFFIPAMVERGRGGHVVNLSSAAGFFATPSLVAYTGTKFAVRGISESLREELAPHGIGVTAICPGVINTPITQSSRLRGEAAEPGRREQIVDTYRRRNYGPDRVARNILKAVERNRMVAPISPEAWFAWGLTRLSPRLARWTARRIDSSMRR